MVGEKKSRNDERNSEKKEGAKPTKQYNFDVSELDNFFPYVEFCDSGESEEETSSTPVESRSEEMEIPTPPHTNLRQENNEKNTIQKPTSMPTDEPIEKFKIKPALCVPSNLSPPPIPERNPTFRKPIGRAKIAKPIRSGQGRCGAGKEGGLFLKKGASINETEAVQQLHDECESNDVMSAEDGIVAEDDDEPSNGEDEKKDDDKSEARRTDESSADEIKVGEGEYSLTSLIADIDEGDFEDSGPLLNSTRDNSTGIDSDISDISTPILRGENSREARSLKDSFKRRKDPEEKKKKANDERKRKRGAKYNKGRNIASEDGSVEELGDDTEKDWSRSRSRSPINQTDKANSGSRRGVSSSNWADVSFGLVLSYAGSERTLSGPRRKMRRGRRKKKSISGSQTDISLSESFRATLKDTRQKDMGTNSFNMSQSQDQHFSGTLRGKSIARQQSYTASPILDSRRNKKITSSSMALSAEDGRPGASASLGSSNNNNNNILMIPYVPGKPSEERGLGWNPGETRKLP